MDISKSQFTCSLKIATTTSSYFTTCQHLRALIKDATRNSFGFPFWSQEHETRKIFWTDASRPIVKKPISTDLKSVRAKFPIFLLKPMKETIRSQSDFDLTLLETVRARDCAQIGEHLIISRRSINS